MRHAAGAAILDVVMDRVGVAARGLERREDRRGLGAARQHEALANDKILEPALLGHHAVRGGIEFGHGVSFMVVDDPYRRGSMAAIGSTEFVMPGLVPGIHVFKRGVSARTWIAGTSPAMTQEQYAPRAPHAPLRKDLRPRRTLRAPGRHRTDAVWRLHVLVWRC